MLRRNILKTLIAVGALALSFSSADAVPVTFNFNGSGTSFTDLGTGLTLTVGAGGFNVTGDFKTFSAAGTVTTQASGLGVSLNTAGGTGALPKVNSLGNASNGREALSFTFGRTVKLISVDFKSIFFGLNGPIIIFEKSGANLVADAGNNLLQGPDSFNPTGTAGVLHANSSLALGAANYLGSQFAIGAKGGTNFFLSSITVDVQPIPVPAAGLLLGSVVLLPLLRRKRRR